MACQKVCKHGRDGIIVKVNLQSPIPASFYITVANWCENDAGMRLCKFTFTIIPSLPCLHTFWHAIPTLFTVLMFFKSCTAITDYPVERGSHTSSKKQENPIYGHT